MTDDLPEIPVSHGSGWDAIEWELRNGRHPNWREIARRLADFTVPPPTPMVRWYLADILEGVVKRPSGNPKQRLVLPERKQLLWRNYRLRKLVMRRKEYLARNRAPGERTDPYEGARARVSGLTRIPESMLDKICYPRAKKKSRA